MRRRTHAVAALAVCLVATSAASATTAQVRQWGLASAPAEVSGQLVNVVTAPGAAPTLISVPVTRRMTVLYDTDAGISATLGPSAEMRALPWAFRQEPSTSDPQAALGNNTSQRMVKVKAAELALEPSADAMAQVLRNAVDKRCTTPAGANTCGAHMAAIDELTQAFSQPTSSTTPDPTNPGVRLAKAMRSLQNDQSPWGGTYASRVQIYIAPGVSTSIAAGRGQFRTRGRDGKNHFRNYGWAVRALSRAGGAWIEMYHFRRTPTKTAFTPTEWRDVPTAVATFMQERSPGTYPLDTLHFIVAEVAPTDGCSTLRPGADTPVTRTARASITVVPTPEPLDVIPDSGSPMACTWKRVQTGPVNQRIAANGVGTHRVSGETAQEFGALWRQFYVMS